MGFLKVQKEITKEYLHKQETSNDKSKTHTSHVTGQTFTIQQQRYPTRISKNGEKKFEPLCLTCKGTKNQQDARHWTNECFKWTALKLPDRKRSVKCQRHLQAEDTHNINKMMSKWYNNWVQGLECGVCKSKYHCAELCENNKSITK